MNNNIIDFLNNNTPDNFTRLLKVNNIINQNNKLLGGNYIIGPNLLLNKLNYNYNLSSIPVSVNDLDESIIVLGNEIVKLEKVIKDIEYKIKTCSKAK